MNGRRARIRNRERRAARARAHAMRLAPDVGLMVAWCVEDEIETAKSQTHDALIRLLGDRRTGGIEWRLYRGTDAEDIIAALGIGERSVDWLDMLRQIRARVDAYGGVVVLCTAPATPPPGATQGPILPDPGATP